MDRKTVIEVVGVLGVMGSLLFVGAEVRQSAEATRAATVLQLKQNWIQLNLTYLEVPELAVAFPKMDSVGYANVDVRSRFLVTSSYRVILQNWSNAYYQKRIGTLDDEQWLPFLRDIEYESRRAKLWDIWDGQKYGFDDPFRSLMDSLKAVNFD